MKCRECVGAIPELDINDRFGKGLALLGKGSFGIVTLHNDKDTGGQVVIKSSIAQQPDEQLETAVVREISSLAALQGHPNIVQFIGCSLHTTMLDFVNTKKNNRDDTIESWTAIVLEKADDSLDGYLKSGKFADDAQREKCKSFMYQILLGMDWMHKNGIWHRDLKPQNLLVLEAEERIAVTDFGLAKGGPFQWVKLSPNVFTLWYRAPEILLEGFVKSQAQYGAPADVWSIGMVFWDMFVASGNSTNPAKTDFLRGNDEALQIWKYFRAFSSDGIFDELQVNEKEFVRICAAKLNIDAAAFAQIVSAVKDTRRLFENALHYRLEDDEWDLLQGLTRMNPSNRMTIAQALKHPYFANVSLPFDIDNLPSTPYPILPLLSCAQWGPELNAKMWPVLIDWLYSVTKAFDVRTHWGTTKYRIQPASFFLGLHVLRCYLADKRVHHRSSLQMQGAVALWLGALYQEDVNAIADAEDWAYVMENNKSASLIVDEQKKMFLAVGARMHLPSSWTRLMELIEQKYSEAQIEQFDTKQRECFEQTLVSIECLPSSFNMTETQIAQFAFDICLVGKIRPELAQLSSNLMDDLRATQSMRLDLIPKLDGYQNLMQPLRVSRDELVALPAPQPAQLPPKMPAVVGDVPTKKTELVWRLSAAGIPATMAMSMDELLNLWAQNQEKL